LKILNFFSFIGRSLAYFFSYAIFKPLQVVASFIFRTILIPLYRIYFSVKKWLIPIFAPAKNKIIYPLLTKSTVHIIIIMLGLAVVANNFHIKEIHAEEFDQNTILATLTTTDENQTITETALTATKTAQYARGMNALRTDDGSQNTTSALSNEANNVITSESSGAVLKPGLASTTIGDRARESVEYYIVQGGDTISTIAEKFGISTNTILWENKLGPRDYIKPGDKITILPESGVSHQVKKGDTLAKIATRYGVQISTIMDYNRLVDESAIQPDQILIIPGGTMPEEQQTVPATPRSNVGIFNILETPPPSRVTSSARLLWPGISRKINQYYRGGRHTGIDIDGNTGNPIYAADDGRVEYAGSDRSGYGIHIIINHGGGIKTLYGHASKLYVKAGDSVKRGQTIGAIGCTGRCTGAHIHFEVRVNGSFINPLTYL
jgi:murein DD-endopeptidase MepM/ murein hydrolase activator NlpD